MLVIAHRGYSSSYPENTLLAFYRAANVHADMVELDLTLTADNQPVVIHDETLNRTTNGKGSVRLTTSETIRKLDAGSWFNRDFRGERIPFLIDILKFVDKTGLWLNIEIKPEAFVPRIGDDNIESILNESLKRYRMYDKVIVSSFEPKILQRLKSISPQIKLAPLAAKLQKNFDLLGFSRDIRAYSLHISMKMATPDFIKKAKEQNLKVYVYTVNKESDMEKLFRSGADGIFTDYPERLNRLLFEKGQKKNII